MIQEDGPTSLAATYAALVFSSLFLPTFLIRNAIQCCREISRW